MRAVIALTTLVCSLLIGVVAISAQGEGRGQARTPQNLQVLPKDMTMQQVTQVMQGVRTALGVQCSHCHVGGPADRAKDDKVEKQTARKMMQLVNSLNEQLGAAPGEPKVSCFTCHRGALKPAIAPDGGLEGLLEAHAGLLMK